MNPKLTDRAVGDLPLSHGRADLLEEIMRTPVPNDLPTTRVTPRRSTGRWLAPLAAAATVAALATAPAWWPGDDAGGSDGQRVSPAGPAGQPAPAAPTTGYLAVLEDRGWDVDNVEQGRVAGSISYTRGSDERFETSWAPAAYYEDYVADRERITDPPTVGEPVEVMGAAGLLWAYSANDHTVIREVQEGHWMEFRGSGLGRAAFLELLGTLRLVDEQGFAEALPAEYVTDDERRDEVQVLLEEIEAVTGVGTFDLAAIRSDESDPYHLGADVAGGYACSWIGAYADATASGDDETALQAADVLGTARQWPVLQRMAAEGGFSDVVWQYADEVVAGRVPEGYRSGLGC